jgi:DNA gyrase subunit A
MTPADPPPPQVPGNTGVTDLLIEEELRDSYLKYAMSVIVARALPDVRDGLKPSQRRILVAMNDLGLGPRAKFRKCAKIAGDTSGNYHPHGEGVVYPTLVRLAQDFVMRARLVDGQGNFGAIDGSPPAAMRYTEARLTGPAMELLEDLDKETVDLVRNYDDTRDEPTVLPSRFPNMLVNGGSGIAVGMASNIPPHNLREICDALVAVIEDPAISVQALMEIVPGPDFPTGGLICGRQGIADAYATGRGQLVVRARHVFEEQRGGRERIVFTEIPYNVNLTRLIETIADGVNSGRIDGIAKESGLRDESDMDGIRLVVEVKRDADREVVLNNLFQHTQLQDTFGVNCIALVDGRPELLPLKDMLLRFRDHRVEVIRRRTRFLLREAERQAHVLEGHRIALDRIDEVISLIRKSKDGTAAREGLRSRFGLSTVQANAILEMRLQKLTGLEREKLEAEYAAVMERIAEYRAILADEKLVLQMIVEDLEELKARHGEPRRTEITGEAADLAMEDLVPEEQVIVTLSREGYVKRTPVAAYRTQGRGGKGVTGAETKEEDHLAALYVASTHDHLLLFTDRGRALWLKVYHIPPGARTSKGRALVNLLPLEGEKIASIIPVDRFDGERSLVMATRRGLVKKTALEAYGRPRSTGIIGIRLEEGDSLVDVVLALPGQDLLLATADGYALRFRGDSVRPMGRDTRGVRGIRLRGADDAVVSLLALEEGRTILTACARGMGKRTDIAEYPVKGRGGMGVINVRVTEKNGKVVSVLPVREDDDVLFITRGGMIVRTRADALRAIGRATQGVRLVTLDEGDALVDVSRVVADDEESALRAAEPPRPAGSPASAVPVGEEEAAGDGNGGEDVPPPDSGPPPLPPPPAGV